MPGGVIMRELITIMTLLVKECWYGNKLSLLMQLPILSLFNILSLI